MRLITLSQAISPGEVATEFVPRMRGINSPTKEMIEQIYTSSFEHVVSKNHTHTILSVYCVNMYGVTVMLSSDLGAYIIHFVFVGSYIYEKYVLHTYLGAINFPAKFTKYYSVAVFMAKLLSTGF